MSDTIDILLIDDDKFLHKFIRKTLPKERFNLRGTFDGPSGIDELSNQRPDVILLDVEMPGLSGYEVCTQLKNQENYKDIPVVFLSSHTSLRERLQGYEVGAVDYIVKPVEPEYLITKINLLVSYELERQKLQEEFSAAQKNVIMALTGSSELGLAIKFLEKLICFQDLDDVSAGLLECTRQFSLDCCIMLIQENESYWYASEGTISPIEKELIELCDKDSRFLDFGNRTIINYPQISLLVKNMPLDDMERYGRIKDILPILLAGVNSKINTLATQQALADQGNQLIYSFKQIRNNLYYLGKTLISNRQESMEVMTGLLNELNYDLLRMGLEEEHEEYLLERLDSAIEDSIKKMDSGKEMRDALYFILQNLQEVMSNHDQLVEAFNKSTQHQSVENSNSMGDDIELF